MGFLVEFTGLIWTVAYIPSDIQNGRYELNAMYIVHIYTIYILLNTSMYYSIDDIFLTLSSERSEFSGRETNM